jgi:glycosyltransferase involved in cell wall biosynthesis
MLLDLTIAIPVRNEEINLPGCLKAVGNNLAQKVILIDSGSTDRTKEIAGEFGAEILDFTWNGKYPKKRNWFLQNHDPSTKWILFLDADEYLTDDFKAELREKLTRDDKVGYWLRYSIYFMGKKLKGGYPLKKLALFRLGAGEYERIDEDQWSNLDMEVHEHAVLSGEIGYFKSMIDHKDFRGVTHLNNKHNEYAIWESRRFLKIKDNTAIRSSWTWKQRTKYYLMGTIWVGPAFLFGSFILLGGFRDGTRGLAFAIFKMSYFNQVYCNIQEQIKVNKNNS